MEVIVFSLFFQGKEMFYNCRSIVLQPLKNCDLCNVIKALLLITIHTKRSLSIAIFFKLYTGNPNHMIYNNIMYSFGRV